MISYEDRRYQVFVSSTFRDLEGERQKALQAILELRAFPAGMELFPSADDEQWEFIKREIESSDYYVVIVAGKYGSLAADGISFTEKEYDYAIQCGKPVMAFVFHDLGELKGAHLEQDSERRAKLEQFRLKVSTSRLVRFYKNADELKAQVFHALLTAFQTKPQIGWIRANNARRMEDLEEINQLQKQLMAMREEIATLRAASQDPRDIFARGEDTSSWEIRLNNVPVYAPKEENESELDIKTILQPPFDTFKFTANWTELFRICFSARRRIVDIKHLAEVLSSGIGDQLGPVATSDWASRAQELSFWNCFYLSDIYKALLDMRMQFLGLGYITTEYEGDISEMDYVFYGSYKLEQWHLTERGVVYAASLFGKLRSAS